MQKIGKNIENSTKLMDLQQYIFLKDRLKKFFES